MAISLELVSADKIFHQLPNPPIIVNDVLSTSEDEREALNNLIYSKYGSEHLTNLPSCNCGEGVGIVGEFNRGVFCPNCRSVVKPPIDNEINSILWMRAPDGVAKFINPIVWTMLSKRFTVSRFNIIQWLCDSGYSPDAKVPREIEEIQDAGIVRGYNNFVANFDVIMEFLFTRKKFIAKSKGNIDHLQELLRNQRDCIFSKYLPLPNKSLLIIEEINVGTYVDPIAMGAINAIQTIASIDAPGNTFSPKVKENRTIKTLVKLAEFNEEYVHSGLGGKPGILRRNVFGSSFNFSFRTVISSLTGAHREDEVHIPWPVAITVFRYHILNRLKLLGMTINHAIGYLNEHAYKYDDLLNGIFLDFIAAGDGKGIPVTMGRNPSLARSSLVSVYITKIIPDPKIIATCISILVVKGMNADFDGDECNFCLALDKTLAFEFENLKPHKNVFSLNTPRQVSGNLSMPKPVVSSVSDYIDTPEIPDPVKLSRMEALYM